jgi:hypothetical protein
VCTLSTITSVLNPPSFMIFISLMFKSIVLPKIPYFTQISLCCNKIKCYFLALCYTWQSHWENNQSFTLWYIIFCFFNCYFAETINFFANVSFSVQYLWFTQLIAEEGNTSNILHYTEPANFLVSG